MCRWHDCIWYNSWAKRWGNPDGRYKYRYWCLPTSARSCLLRWHEYVSLHSCPVRSAGIDNRPSSLRLSSVLRRTFPATFGLSGHGRWRTPGRWRANWDLCCCSCTICPLRYEDRFLSYPAIGYLPGPRSYCTHCGWNPRGVLSWSDRGRIRTGCPCGLPYRYFRFGFGKAYGWYWSGRNCSRRWDGDVVCLCSESPDEINRKIRNLPRYRRNGLPLHIGGN